MTVETVLFIAMMVTLLGALLILIRALLGPTVFDRVLALNMMGTKTVIFLVLLGFLDPAARPGFIDIALLYALINYVTTVAILRFIEQKRLG